MTNLSTPEFHDLTQPALELVKVSVRYGKTLALDQISLRILQGERLAIIGPNGAGKSTFFNIVAGVLKPTTGQVTIYGSKPNQHACIAYVPQRSQVDWQFPATVADVVMMGRVGRIGLFRWARRRDWNYVYNALDQVEMTRLAKRQIGDLSGGQQQRVFIARAIAQEADLLLLDEPFSGLDAGAQDALFAILNTLSERQVTILIATHNIHIAAERFTRLLLLKQQVIGLGTPSQVLMPTLLSQAYGGQMHLIETAQGTILVNEAHLSNA